MFRVVIALCCCACFTYSSLAHSQEKRVALVIGNSAYKTSPLANPVNDARAIAGKLKTLGFDVVTRENLKVAQIPEVLREFRNRVQPGSVAMFFYAGHGLQLRGVNYLPAVDANVQGEDEVPLQSININQVLEIMEDSKTRLNLVFLDACRNNPFARSFRSAAGGLARVNAPSGTLISFATRPGSIASDGTGKNGLYTEYLLKEIVKPNQPVEQVLKGVVIGVKKVSQGKQEPWMEGSLDGDFYFSGGPVAVASAQPGAPAAIGEAAAFEMTFWDSIKDSSKTEDYRAYISKYPEGQFATLAEARLASLAPPMAAASTSGRDAASPGTQAAAAAPAGAGSVFKDCKECPDMVVVPAGTFQMGTARSESGSGENERPRHEVKIAKMFAAGRFEVTRAQFAAFVADSGYKIENTCYVWQHSATWENQQGRNWRDVGFRQADDHPVVCVSWKDAQAYLAWLGRKTGKAYRLPTEPEWEYFARAGTKTSRYWGDDLSLACEYANVHDKETQSDHKFDWEAHDCKDGYSETSPAGKFKPNPFGLYDVMGNAWEWTEDCLTTNYINAPADGSASVTEDCPKRVYRGGGWSGPALPRSGVRNGNQPTYRSQLLGFRVVRPLP
jgi:formylglycine-generating enzyme required for sulfatase activity